MRRSVDAVVELETRILAKNDALAAKTRAWFAGRRFSRSTMPSASPPPAPAVQVNTGTGCDLEADMAARGLAELKPTSGSVVMIENLANLVLPRIVRLGYFRSRPAADTAWKAGMLGWAARFATAVRPPRVEVLFVKMKSRIVCSESWGSAFCWGCGMRSKPII
jgi:hypothetical protein